MSTAPTPKKSKKIEHVSCAVVTVSNTRTPETDTSGKVIEEMLVAAGHKVEVRKIIPDNPDRMLELMITYRDREGVDAILITGGTGLSSKDETYETIHRLLDKRLPGYGELVRWVSYQEVGPIAMCTRATGGILRKKVLLTMPASPAGARTAMEKIILPALSHLATQAQK